MMDKPSLGSRQAFPVPWPDGPPAPGMTLREYYAGLAMQGVCANSDSTDWTAASVATVAVALTDALIAALEAKSNG